MEYEGYRRARRLQRRRRIMANRIRLRRLRDVSDPFDATEELFQAKFRLSKELARALFEELRPHLLPNQRETGVPIEIKVVFSNSYLNLPTYSVFLWK